MSQIEVTEAYPRCRKVTGDDATTCDMPLALHEIAMHIATGYASRPSTQEEATCSATSRRLLEQLYKRTCGAKRRVTHESKYPPR